MTHYNASHRSRSQNENALPCVARPFTATNTCLFSSHQPAVAAAAHHTSSRPPPWLRSAVQQYCVPEHARTFVCYHQNIKRCAHNRHTHTHALIYGLGLLSATQTALASALYLYGIYIYSSIVWYTQNAQWIATCNTYGGARRKRSDMHTRKNTYTLVAVATSRATTLSNLIHRCHPQIDIARLH